MGIRTEELVTNQASSFKMINLDHPRYGVGLRILGVFLFGCATGVSVIFIDLVRRLQLATGHPVVDRVLPFVLGLCVAWIIAVAAVAVGIDQADLRRTRLREGSKKTSAKRTPTQRAKEHRSTGQRVALAILAMSIIIAGVRVGKTMEAQRAQRQHALATAQEDYKAQLKAWRATEDGQEYSKAKAQIRKLRALGAKLLEDGRRLSHPKKRKDGAALLAAAKAIDITTLEKTMPLMPDAKVVVPPMPWWMFANVVVWPALFEFVCTELLVLAVAFWASKAFAPLEMATAVIDEEEVGDEDDLFDARLMPDGLHPAFFSFRFDRIEAVFEAEPDSLGAEAWEEAKQGLNLTAATWRGLRITAGPQWTKRIGTTRRRYIWPVIAEVSGRTVFIGTQAALRIVAQTPPPQR